MNYHVDASNKFVCGLIVVQVAECEALRSGRVFAVGESDVVFGVQLGRQMPGQSFGR